MDSANHVGNRGAPLRRGAFVPVIIMLLAPPSLISDNSQAGVTPLPVVTVSLDPSGQEAVVSDYASGNVTFIVNVTLKYLPICRGVAEIKSYVDLGWAVDPPTIMFIPTDCNPEEFSLKVTVPPGTPADSIGTLGVVVSEYCCYAVGSAQAKITVKLYYGVKVETPDPYEEISPAGQAVFQLNAINIGNSNDSYDVEIANLNELQSKGLMVTLDGQNSNVLSGESTPFQISLTSTSNGFFWKGEAITIIVKASSLNARGENSAVSDTFRFVVYQKMDTPDPVLVGSTFWIAIFSAISAVVLAGTDEKKAGNKKNRRKSDWKKGGVS